MQISPDQTLRRVLISRFGTRWAIHLTIYVDEGGLSVALPSGLDSRRYRAEFEGAWTLICDAVRHGELDVQGQHGRVDALAWLARSPQAAFLGQFFFDDDQLHSWLNTGQRRGYDRADAHLIAKAEQLMRDDSTLSPWAAVSQLGDDLPGRGNLESRQKRIYSKLIAKLKRTENN